MRTLFLIALLAPVAVPLPLKAATRNYSVTSFERVRVEWPYAISLVTNSAPFARASGTQTALDAVSIRVEGTTLIIQANRSAWGGSNASPGPVLIAVGTHDLRTASISGSGSLSIDRVRGLEFALSVGGAAEGRVANADVDRFKLAVNGSGKVTLSGKAPALTATVLGPAVVDATGFLSKDAIIAAQGASTVTFTATNSAKITAAGTANVAVSGNPACTVKALGSATVSGCR
jgi:hypothetical protein